MYPYNLCFLTLCFYILVEDIIDTWCTLSLISVGTCMQKDKIILTFMCFKHLFRTFQGTTQCQGHNFQPNYLWFYHKPCLKLYRLLYSMIMIVRTLYEEVHSVITILLSWVVRYVIRIMPMLTVHVLNPREGG